MGKSEIFGHRYGKTKDQGTHSKKAAAALPHFHFHFHVGPPLSPSHLFFFAAPTRTMSIGRLLFPTRISRTGQSKQGNYFLSVFSFIIKKGNTHPILFFGLMDTHPSLFFFNDGANACRPTWEPNFLKSFIFPIWYNLFTSISLTKDTASEKNKKKNFNAQAV